MTESFIEKARVVHGDRYDYSKVDYKGYYNKVTIICKEHDDFEQRAGNHLNGAGCSKCTGTCKSNTKEFVEKSKKIHDDKYDYTEVNYKNNTTKVDIICPKYGHGVFQQTPKSHLKGAGCGKCGGTAKITECEFLDKCREKHGDLYDYTRMNYTNFHNTITIACKKHGVISITPKYHLNGVGCTQCSNMLSGNERKTPLDIFIKKCREKHGDSYDYSKVDYLNNNTKVNIICPKYGHGVFQQTPDKHLNRGSRCPKCTGYYTLTTEEFIKKSKETHGDRYGYAKVNYSNTNSIVIIFCKEHGDFEQNARSHIRGAGCPQCANNGYSKPSILWLDFLSKLYNINIQHACNFGEYLIPETKYKADGFCKENNTIYEFHGDYWHGNPMKFNPDDINEKSKKTFKELYDETLIRENKIKELGYNLVTIWEYDWKKINRCIKILQNKFTKYHN